MRISSTLVGLALFLTFLLVLMSIVRSLADLIYLLSGIASSVSILVGGLRARRRAEARQAPSLAFPERLMSKYELIEFLGEGGFSRVYRCRRREDGKLVAVKVPKEKEEAGRSFLEEVQNWKRLKHYYILDLYDCNVHPYPHIEMELHSRSLDQIIQEMDERSRSELLAKIAYALRYAHSKGVVHGDLKPSNILIDYEDGEIIPKLSDWGLGHTPAYSPPEVVMGERRPDFRADVWGFGVIAYELLTGKNPFKGEDDIDTLGRVKSLKVDTSPLGAYKGIVARCLERAAEKRYASMAEVAEEIKKLNLSQHSHTFSSTTDRRKKAESALRIVSDYIQAGDYEKASERLKVLEEEPSLLAGRVIEGYRSLSEILTTKELDATFLEIKWKHILEVFPPRMRKELEEDEYLGRAINRILLHYKQMGLSIREGTEDYEFIRNTFCRRLSDKLRAIHLEGLP